MSVAGTGPAAAGGAQRLPIRLPAGVPLRAPAAKEKEEEPLRTGAPELPQALPDDPPLGDFFWRPAAPAAGGGAPGNAAGTAKVLMMQQQQIATLQQQVRVLQRQLEKVQTEDGERDEGGAGGVGPGLLGPAPPSVPPLAARRYPEGAEADLERSTEDMREAREGDASVTSSQDRADLSLASSASGLETVRSSLRASVDPEAVASLKEALANAVTRAANAAAVAIHGSKGSSASASMEVSLADSRDSADSSGGAMARALLDLPSTSSSGDAFMEDSLGLEEDFGGGALPPRGLLPSETLDELGVPRVQYPDLSDDSDDEETERLISKYLGRDAAAAFASAELSA